MSGDFADSAAQMQPHAIIKASPGVSSLLAGVPKRTDALIEAIVL